MRIPSLLAAVAALSLAVPAFAAAKPHHRVRPHNVVIFVADGLRSNVVNAQTGPELEALRHEGVDFRNSHSQYPTLTTVNAAVIATGHQPGDTGDFANALWVGEQPLPGPGGSIAGLEDDTVLGQMNDRFGGNFLHETSLIAAARAKGYATAIMGKEGPAAIQDVTARDGQTLIIDDSTGHAGGLPLRPDVARAIEAAGLKPVTPERPKFPHYADRANVEQQQWLTEVAAKVVLPRLKASGKPFVLLFWSRDPDISQHAQCDGCPDHIEGINGPTSLAAVANASATLGRLRAALKAQGLAASTDIFVTADHGFSTVGNKDFAGADKPHYVLTDLARALDLPSYDARLQPAAPGKSIYLGADPKAPEVVVVNNGGSDLIYLPTHDRTLARKVVEALAGQAYVSALFVNDEFGAIPGALPMSLVGLRGAARTPTPSIVVGLSSHGGGCRPADICAVEAADVPYADGQGMHGSFSRGDTHNFMAAIGPDFKRRFVDPAPVANYDIAPTLARVLHLDLPSIGKLKGRVLSEAFAGAPVVKGDSDVVRSAPAANGFVTVLDRQRVGAREYYDAAGKPGTVFGLKP